MPSIETELYHTFISALTVVTLLLGVFAFSIVHHVRRKRIQMKAKSFQDECNMEVDRKRIAADLHDDFGSLLTGLKLSLGELSHAQPGNILFEHSTTLLDQSLIRLRDISLNLVPRELESEGLHAAIETLVERINETGRFHVYYTSSFEDALFNIEKAMILFRVIQELTTNAIKHSEASGIGIGIAGRGGRLIIEVLDDGKGFDYETAQKQKKSSGLKNIQSRLDLLNGAVHVESGIGRGTHYFINIPIQQLISGNHV